MKRKQQCQRPLLNHLTSEKTKLNFRCCPDAPGWVYLSETYHPLSRGLITPCPETFHPLHLPETYHPLPNYKRHLNWRIPKTSHLTNVSLITSTNLPLNMKPPWSLLHSAWLLGWLSPLLAWIKVTYFRWGPLSFFFASTWTIPYILGAKTWERARHSSHSLCLSYSPSLSLFSLFLESGSVNTHRAHFLPGLIRSPRGCLVPLRVYKPCSKALPVLCVPPGLGSTLLFSLSLSDDLWNRELLTFDHSTCNTPLKPAPRLR